MKEEITKLLQYISNYISKFPVMSHISISFTIIGIIFPSLYSIGYVFLYGMYFSATNISFLEMSFTFVPLSVVACNIAGALFVVTILYLWSLFKNWKDNKTYVLSNISMIFVAHISLTSIFITTNIDFQDYVYKFMLVWIGPIILTIMLLLLRFYFDNAGRWLGGVIYSLVIIMIAYSYFDFDESLLPLLVFISSTLISVLFKKINLSDGTSVILSSIFMLLFLVGMLIKRMVGPLDNNDFLILFAFSLIFSIVILKLEISIVSKINNMFNTIINSKINYNDNHYLLISKISLLILIIPPLIALTSYFTGRYIGDVVDISELRKTQDIHIGNEHIEGQLIAKDNTYLYISEKGKLLLIQTGNRDVKIKFK